ncbi:NirA family protein [Cognatishimia activa]|uniref:Sulfite reductase [ferredoxin] n=1 Tax=Cognatishimia activa TaxID=1715691 RepID=A0A0P1IT97_9RHOB|nr:NirA family protein [Cognatishimia activa]CUI76729.1 Sulfite reductase [ferredoxin] [Cognatishimia activa]CUK26751.1 Sulfite reductase [ferredoxin] [Cognatishimia activa]
MSQTGPGFSTEQQKYLIDALSKINLNRLVPSQGGGAAAEEETVYGVPLEDLCKEEVAKYETHPLDMWRQIEKWEAEGHLAEGLDQFLLRHHGFFNVTPASPGYMMRLRLPGCVMRSDQMSMLANVAEENAGGYSHVTTRGSLQLREILPGNIIPIVEKLQTVGLTAQGTGADSARNLTCSPTAGFDPQELLDTRPLTSRLSIRILKTKELQGLPRKFNISFDGGGVISCASDTNDIAFQAVTVLENDQGIEPGLWFRIALGGITGHKDFAKDTGLACRVDEAVDVAEAMLRVYVEHGNRTNRGKARLKYVLDDKGAAWFCERTQEKLDEEFNTGIKLTTLPAGIDAPRATIDRQGHIGVHPQKQDGLNYIGVSLELGRLTPEQMRGLARIAKMYGSDDIRLTVWQNPMIVGVPDDLVETVQSEVAALGMGTDATAFAAGAVACTGKWACKLAAAYTKQDALKIVRHLESKFTLDQPINIHLTGCANSCAQHYIGDIGMVGAALAGGAEGYNIVIGGGTDQDQGLARTLCGPVPAEDTLAILEHVVGAYLERREPGQTFLAFTRSLDDAALQTLLPADNAMAA